MKISKGTTKKQIVRAAHLERSVLYHPFETPPCNSLTASGEPLLRGVTTEHKRVYGGVDLGENERLLQGSSSLTGTANLPRGVELCRTIGHIIVDFSGSAV